MKPATLNILVLIATDKLSGPARQVIQLVDYVNRKEFNLILASTWREEGAQSDFSQDDFFGELINRSVPLHILRQHFRFDPFLLWKTQKLIKSEKIHIIQTHSYKPAVIGFFMKWITRVSWIAFMHGETWEDMKVRIYQELGFILVRFADRVITVSNEMRDRYIRRGLDPKKVIAIHNALDPSLFKIRVDRRKLRQDLGIEGKEKVIGVIGRLSQEKGQQFFLDAFKKLSDSHNHVRALLVGKGKDEEVLRHYCRSHNLDGKVIFLDYRKEISDIYNLVDIVVLPSFSEGLPNVVLEALFHQKPVIATRVGGVPEVILDGDTGIVIPPGDIDALVQAMQKVLFDESLRTHLQSNGKFYLQKEFSPEARVRKITDVYNAIAVKKAVF